MLALYKKLALWLFLCSISLVVYADSPNLTLPLNCTLGIDCFIQNYVDADASANYRDYHCGFLSYDGHKGTDFRPKAFNVLENNIPVFAAAAGKVRAIRDGMQDINVRVIGKAALQGKEAGNSVVIVHGDDWETQYEHLKRGSVSVKAGEIVAPGTLLGYVGLSGNTEFLHLHFEVRYQGKTVDPFIGIGGGETCGLGKQPLWSKETLSKINYLATDIFAAGFIDRPLASNEIPAEIKFLPANAQALVFWTMVVGVQTEDMQVIDLLAPDGTTLLHKIRSFDHNIAQTHYFVGLKRHAALWATGDYRVNYQLVRKQQSVLNKQFHLQILAD